VFGRKPPYRRLLNAALQASSVTDHASFAAYETSGVTNHASFAASHASSVALQACIVTMQACRMTLLPPNAPLLTCNTAWEVRIVLLSIGKDTLQACIVALQGDIVAW